MSGGKKLLIGIIIFTVLACIIKVNSHSSSYHYTNYSKPYSGYRNTRTSGTTSSSNDNKYVGTSKNSTTTAHTTSKPNYNSSKSYSTAKPERTVDPMDHDIESYYLDYQDEFEDEDDAWDDFEDDPDVWDDY